MEAPKTLLLSFLLMWSSLSFGQSLISGLGTTYGSDIEGIGINVREYYFFNHHVCFGPEASFFPNHKVGEYDKSLIELNFTGHYIFELNEHLGIYPLTGLNYSIEKESMHNETKTVDEFGLNIGMGVHYKVKSLFPYIEYKYITGGLSQHVYSLGILFSLSKNKEEKHHSEK